MALPLSLVPYCRSERDVEFPWRAEGSLEIRHDISSSSRILFSSPVKYSLCPSPFYLIRNKDLLLEKYRWKNLMFNGLLQAYASVFDSTAHDFIIY